MTDKQLVEIALYTWGGYYDRDDVSEFDVLDLVIAAAHAGSMHGAQAEGTWAEEQIARIITRAKELDKRLAGDIL